MRENAEALSQKFRANLSRLRRQLYAGNIIWQ